MLYDVAEGLDGSGVLGKRDMLVGGVVEVAIPRTVGHHRAFPLGSDHVHIAGARLEDEARLPAA